VPSNSDDDAVALFSSVMNFGFLNMATLGHNNNYHHSGNLFDRRRHRRRRRIIIMMIDCQ